VINKIDLAPLVGASLEVMARDAKVQRGERPTLFTNLRDREGVDAVVSWVEGEIARHAEAGTSQVPDAWLDRVRTHGLPGEFRHTHADGTSHAHPNSHDDTH
jgi:hypothetical protein